MNETEARKGFLPEVESLRGLAEFGVEYSHIYGVMASPMIAAGLIPGGGVKAYGLLGLSLLFSSAAAVSMFSVISGFVLGRMLDMDRSRFTARKCGRFVWRRFWRIAPAHIVVVVAIILLSEIFIVGRPIDLALFPLLHSSMGDYINGVHVRDLSRQNLLANISFLSIGINPVTWYLNVELSVCFIFPLLHFVARKERWCADLAILLFVMALTVWWNPSYAKPFFFLVYLPGFYLGLLIESWGRRLVDALWRFEYLPGPAIVLFYLAMVYLLVLLPGKSALRIHLEVLCGFMILAFIVWAPPKTLSQIFSARLLRWVGRIAYSSYLIHCLVLVLLFRCVFLLTPVWFAQFGLALVFGSMVAIVAVTFALASASFIWVEQPANRLGQRMIEFILARHP